MGNPTNTENGITAYARTDRYAAMRSQLELGQFNGILLRSEQPKAPAEQRIVTAGTPDEAEFAKVGLSPLSTVFPYGVGVYEDEIGWVLLTHAPTEIYLEIPPGATKLKCWFGLADGVAGQRDFDGLGINIELMHSDGAGMAIHSEWMAPGTERVSREIEVMLPADRPSLLLYHVVAGPQNQNAHDQAWLRYLRFE